MDKEGVISLTTDLEALNTDMQNWQMMSFNMRKRADDACYSKYGRNNVELYTLLRDKIEERDEKLNTVSEATDSSDDMTTRIDKINLANSIMQRTGEVIINPWIVDDVPDYDSEELTKRYNQYIGLYGDLKTQSDFDSQNIWGYSVHDMYVFMVDKLKSHEEEVTKLPVEIESTLNRVFIEEQAMRTQLGIMNERCDNEDILIDRVMGLDCIAYYESNELKYAVKETIQSQGMNYGYGYNSKLSYMQDLPDFVPNMTPTEYEMTNRKHVDPYHYIYDIDCKNYHEFVLDRMTKLDIIDEMGNPDEVRFIRKELLEAGWNPYIPFTDTVQSQAKHKMNAWFKENCDVRIIDLSGYTAVDEASNPKSNLEPIYITLLAHNHITNKVISAYTKSIYSHAGISLDEKLDNIYSFNGKSDDGTPGFSVENIPFWKDIGNGILKVMAIFVTKEAKNKIKQNIEYYKKNKDKTDYAVKDIFNIILRKTKDSTLSLNMICSQFVDSMLKLANIDITGKSSNLVVPGDFEKPNTSKVFVMYNGYMNDYNPKTVKSKVNKLLAGNLNPDGLSILPLVEAVDAIFTDKTIDSFYVRTGSEKSDKILSEIREILEPKACILEAKPFPFRFNKNGDLYLDLPKDLEQEYQEAHRLLEYYDETNLEGIKHELARLFYINSIIEEKLKRMDKKDPEYKRLIDLRARVLNDFKKYLKVVQKAEPNFDFEEYLKNSEYYNKTVKIDNHTLKYTGKTIKKLLEIILKG